MAERFLVVHDYGMGALWWWIRADSAEQIRLTIADVVVHSGPEAERRAPDDLDEFDLADVDRDPALIGLRQRRTEQRDQQGFGALAGRERVFLRQPPSDGIDEAYLLEFDADGYRVRQVELRPDGARVRSDEEHWPFNPPYDLYDPKFAALEITEAEFERAWNGAEWYTEDDDQATST